MAAQRTVDQHIAVFGEAGSGKTVLVSSFYGQAQEPDLDWPYTVTADKQGQGAKLHQNYLGMRNSSQAPQPTKFEANSYAFSVKLRNQAEADKNMPFDVFRLIWHDYPGEWFEEDPSGEEEEKRRIDTFRSLLKSDIAFLLVDGQRLLDNTGEEERYLKSVFTNFSNGLLALREDILIDGESFEQFPRIWIIALSKADLLPDLDVVGFRDLVIEKAAGEVIRLSEVISGFVTNNEALDVGEDFILLSSAKFEAGTIEVGERVGVDLVLPLAAMLPLERHTKWSGAKLLPGQAAEKLFQVGALGAGAVAAAMLGRKMWFGKMAIIQGVISAFLSKDTVDDAVNLVGEKLREVNADAVEKHQHLTAMLTGFKMALEDGEKRRIFLRSRR